MAFRDPINDLMYRFYERFKQNNNRLPVSVDADINVGDVQIGTVKQGGVDEGAEPWKVKAEELEQKIDAFKQSIESGVQLKGSSMEFYVNDWSELPDPTQVPKGATAQLIGTFEVRQNTGTEWVTVL